MAISHHHSDHYGGMDQVIRAYKPRYFLASSSGHSTKLYLNLLKTVEAQGMTADPADVEAPQDRAGLRRADDLPSAAGRQERGKQ